MKALLFGQYAGPPQAVPALLGRAGFEVHALTTDAALGRCRQLASCRVAASFPAMLRQLLDEGPDRYDLIVVGDDATLLDLKTADIALVDKLTILPIMDERDLGHIASKIGLSHTLKAANISVPAFRAADHRAELAAAVEQLGFPPGRGAGPHPLPGSGPGEDRGPIH